MSDPRAAILDVVSAALRPLVEGNNRVSPGTAAAATERAAAKVLAAFEERRKGAKRKEGGGALATSISAFLTDSQRAKISQFARDCLEAEDAKEREKKRQRLE